MLTRDFDSRRNIPGRPWRGRCKCSHTRYSNMTRDTIDAEEANRLVDSYTVASMVTTVDSGTYAPYLYVASGTLRCHRPDGTLGVQSHVPSSRQRAAGPLPLDDVLLHKLVEGFAMSRDAAAYCRTRPLGDWVMTLTFNEYHPSCQPPSRCRRWRRSSRRLASSG